MCIPKLIVTHTRAVQRDGSHGVLPRFESQQVCAGHLWWDGSQKRLHLRGLPPQRWLHRYRTRRRKDPPLVRTMTETLTHTCAHMHKHILSAGDLLDMLCIFIMSKLWCCCGVFKWVASFRQLSFPTHSLSTVTLKTHRSFQLCVHAHGFCMLGYVCVCVCACVHECICFMLFLHVFV